MVKITTGTAQGSTLRPDLSQNFYDAIFRKKMPEDALLARYVDDIVAVLVECDTDDCRENLTKLLDEYPLE